MPPQTMQELVDYDSWMEAAVPRLGRCKIHQLAAHALIPDICIAPVAHRLHRPNKERLTEQMNISLWTLAVLLTVS